MLKISGVGWDFENNQSNRLEREQCSCIDKHKFLDVNTNVIDEHKNFISLRKE